MQLSVYTLFEYIGIYDSMDKADRMKYLGVGCQIFEKNGLNFLIYQKFHRIRASRLRVLKIGFRMFFVGVGLFCFQTNHQLAWISIAIIFGTMFMRKFIFHIKSEQNILLVNEILEKPNSLDHISELLTIPEGDVNAFKSFADRFSRATKSSGILVELKKTENLSAGILIVEGKASKREEPFESQLLCLSQKKNLFNDMPMHEVLDYFKFFWKDIAKGEIPLLTEVDFLLFINSAFLGIPLSNKLYFNKVKVILIYDIFYRFYIDSANKYYDLKYQRKPKYVRLVVDNFAEFDLEKTLNNFKPMKKGGITAILNSNSILKKHK